MATIGNQPVTITDCSICFDTLNKPKALPCLHTFCLQCLVKYGHVECKDDPGDELPCPLCRQLFIIPDGGLDKLPTNFFIEYMLNTSCRNSSATVAGCQTCVDGNFATKYCVQ